MTQRAAPNLVLLRWPSWSQAEPDRSRRADFLLGMKRDDGTIDVLLNVCRGDPGEAVALMDDPAKLRRLLADEVCGPRAEPADVLDGIAYFSAMKPDPLASELLKLHAARMILVQQQRDGASDSELMRKRSETAQQRKPPPGIFDDVKT